MQWLRLVSELGLFANATRLRIFLSCRPTVATISYM